MTEVDPAPYRVMFADRLDLHTPAEPGVALVAPRGRGWNDFGFEIDVTILIQPRGLEDAPPVVVEGYLGFIAPQTAGELDTIGNAAHDARYLRDILPQMPGGLAPAKAFPEFFTMLPDMAAYRFVVSSLGPDEAVLALRALHDMVEADDAASPPSWLSLAFETEVFRRAFLRSTDAYFAWRNAGSLLSGLAFETVSHVSQALRIEFHLNGRPNTHQLEFNFDQSETVLPKRFSVIIGPNGIGKSQALGRIAHAALRGSDELTDEKGERPLFNRILAFSSAPTSTSVFPPERRRDARAWYRRFSLNSARIGRRSHTTSELIVELVRTNEVIRDTGRLSIFQNAIEAIEGHQELALRLEPRTGGGAILIERLQRGGERQRLDQFSSIDRRFEPVRLIEGKAYPLSSGELAFLRFAALASLYAENGTLMLLDEPETHLHPRFISQFVALLDTVLARTGSVAIIATHSAYFVREAFEDQVVVLRSLKDRTISVEAPTLKTFGADVGAISYFVFGEDQLSQLAKSVERGISTGAGSWDEIYERYKGVLSLELLGEIRALIEARATRETDT